MQSLQLNEQIALDEVIMQSVLSDAKMHRFTQIYLTQYCSPNGRLAKLEFDWIELEEPVILVALMIWIELIFLMIITYY